MEDLHSLAPFIAALRQVTTAPEARLPAGSKLDQRFHSLLQEEIKLENGEREDFTNQVLQFPITTVALFRPKADNTSASSAGKQPAPTTELKICKPLPDELLQGWQGRMRAINLQPDDKSLASLMAAVIRHQDGSVSIEADFIEHAAIVLGMSRDSLIKHHTLTPFFSALEGLRPSKPGTKSVGHRKAYERQAPFRLGSRFPRYCRQCAQEEYKQKGYSFWHRLPQLPGMLWCETHGTPLALAPRQNAFDQQPHAVTDSFIDERLEGVTDDQVAVLRRYAQIAEEVLRLAPVIDCVAASKILGEGARAADLRVSRQGVRPTVSSQLVRLLPDWWLADTVPRVRWAPDKHLWTIDSACVPGATRYTTTTLCLLAALLYEDASTTTARLLGPVDTAPERTRGFDYWSSRAILDEYIAQKGVVSRVAERLGLPHSTVGIGLLNQGLPGLGKMKSSDALLAVHAFLEGQSFAEAIASTKADTAEIEDLLRAAGYRLKTALDAILSEIFYQIPPSTQIERRRATG